MKIETKVGLFVILGAIILIAGIIWKSNLMLRTNGYVIVGSFKTVNGLLKGSEVRYRGYLIGSVAEVDPGPESIKVFMYVQNGIEITEGSKLRVDFDGLIGEKYINVIPNINTKILISNGAVLTGYAASGLVDFVDAGTDNLMETKKILEVLRKIITSEDSQNSLQGLIVNINKISERLDSVMTKVDVLFDQNNVKNMANNLNSIILGLNATVGNLNHLIKGIDGSVDQKDVKSIVNNLKTLTDKMNKISDSISKDKDVLLLDMQPIIKGTKEVIKNTESLTSSLKKSTNFVNETSLNIKASAYSNSSYDLGGDMSVGSQGIELGFGKTQTDPNVKIRNLTFGTKMGKIRTSVGLVESYPGIKVDIPLNDKMRVESAVYTPSNLTYMLRTGFGVLPNFKAIFGLEQNQQNSAFTFGFGVDSAY